MTKVLSIRNYVLSPKCDIYLTHLPSGNIMEVEPEGIHEPRIWGIAVKYMIRLSQS